MQAGTLRGLTLATIGLCAAGAIVGATFYFQPIPRDEETLCQKLDHGRKITESETAHHVLVVDKSDKWNQAQAARLRSLVIHTRDELGVNERMSIFVFSSAVEQGFSPAFSRCNPGRASDTSFLISNPKRWEKRFEASFGQPLDQVLNDLTLPATGPLSPILEVLVDLTNRQELVFSNIPRRIIFVSDMIQNTKAYSLFPSNPPSDRSVPSTRPPVGGPLVLLPVTPPSASAPNATKGAIAKPRPIEPHKLKSDELVKLVESRGGLGNLQKFRIEVYQIRGVYPEARLAMAREFWDLLATQYGAKIEWKVL